MTTACSDKEQSGGGEDAAVDGPEGGAGHEEGHDPRHYAQQSIAERLKNKI